MGQRDPVRAGIIKESFADRSYRDEGTWALPQAQLSWDRVEPDLSFLSCSCFPLASRVRCTGAWVIQSTGSVAAGAENSRAWLWGQWMVSSLKGLVNVLHRWFYFISSPLNGEKPVESNLAKLRCEPSTSLNPIIWTCFVLNYSHRSVNDTDICIPVTQVTPDGLQYRDSSGEQMIFRTLSVGSRQLGKGVLQNLCDLSRVIELKPSWTRTSNVLGWFTFGCCVNLVLI